MSCAICQIRRPRRACPGVHGDICAICCGAEREVTVTCPFDCEYLQEARKHEIPMPFAPGMGHPDIRVSEPFLEEHSPLMLATARALLGAAGGVGAVDSDLREALESLIQTYRTLQSGLIYQTLPANPMAAAVQRGLQQSLEEFRRQETTRLGMSKTRDADVLHMLVFFARLGQDRNNGRPRCRAFLDILRKFEMGEAAAAEAQAPSLIVPY